MNDILEIAAANQQRARDIIRDTDLEAIWRSVGAEVNLVGSLRTGLLMTHRDIDFHIYSSSLTIADSFAAMTQLAENPRIRRIEYGNLLDAQDQCLEWHAWYADADDLLWQIAAVLTDETRRAILQIKYDTPETVKIMGIEYYQAVLRDGVRTYAQFEAWRAANPINGILEWMP